MAAAVSRDAEAPDPRTLARMFRSFPSFCALLKIVDIETGLRRPMVLTSIQKRYHRRRTRRDIVLKARKVFMTTLEVARDLWCFLTQPGAQVVIVCQSEKGNLARRTIQEMLRVALESLRQSVAPFGVRIGSSDPKREGRFDIETDTELVWRERDARLRIIEAGAAIRTAAKTGRAGLVTRLHATEVAFWEHGAETLNSLLNAMPPNGGEAVIESTPNGAAGYYYEQWQKAVGGSSTFTAHFFEWWQHPAYRIALAPGERVVARDPFEERLLAAGVSPEALKWYRKKQADVGPQKATQEFPSDPITCFLVSGRGFFDGLAVQRLIDKARAPVYSEHAERSGSSGQQVGDQMVPAVRVWEKPRVGEEYVVGSDTSDGTGGSAGTGVVIHRATGKHVATLWGQFRPWVLAEHLASLARYYNDADVAVERNNTGGTVLRALEVEQKYAHVVLDWDKKPGLLTTGTSRAQMLDTFEEAVRRRAFDTDDLHLCGEMRTFVVKVTPSGERPQHAEGARDDLVFGGAIGWEAACRKRRPRDRDLDPDIVQ